MPGNAFAAYWFTPVPFANLWLTFMYAWFPLIKLFTAITLTPFFCDLFLQREHSKANMKKGESEEPIDPYKDSFLQGYKCY